MLARNMNANLEPFRERRNALDQAPDHIWDTLHDGARRAREIAEATMHEVRAAVGLPE